MSKLLIVESPAKCKKIQGYLGSGWRVQATMGHIRALKEDLTAIGFKADATKQTWTPSYEVIASKRDAIASLKKAAAGAEVYLGSDDDREGEAIAWHTCQVLGLDPETTKRVIFHEITEKALQDAVANPTVLDMDKFYAQQARTMLDMLIGFTLSPCLWRGVGYSAGLSAGRCQTPALRIIYDRDREIEGHAASCHWNLQAVSDPDDLIWKGVKEETEASAVAILKTLVRQKPQTLVIQDRQERISTSQPSRPFITSSLQQEASSRLSMNPKVTMRLAQTLYEAGHITYMRTDNPVMSDEAVAEAGSVVEVRWGADYLYSASTKHKKVKAKAKPTNIQGAHEGIRPTHFDVVAVEGPEGRLYELIWKRAIQSVMAPETRDCVKLISIPQGTEVKVETTWDKTRFAGYKVMDLKPEEEAAEAAVWEARRGLVVGTSVPWKVFTATEVYTKPPSRYTEASLIRDLESRGIGRPSTYATLVETVMERGYVEKATIAAVAVTVRGLELKAGSDLKATSRTEKAGGEKDKLRTTALGRKVMEWLLETFGDMLTYEFTADMEKQLDQIAHGSEWSFLLERTWEQYADRYRAIMSAPPVSSGPKGTDFGDGYKLVVTKKGPLFVLEAEGQKTRFATLPAGVSADVATRADAEQAFTVAEGECLGTWEDAPVVRKKGPYGHYVCWKEKRVSCKADETLEAIGPRLTADTVDHTIGPYKIRRGPYGLYMYKTGGKGKPTFVSLSDTTDYKALTVEGAEQLYKVLKAPKKKM